jgi:DNA repair protein SbcC/Rad50
VMQDAPAEQRASLRSAAESFIAGVARWPKASLQALQQALSRAESASAGDGESRAKALRMLCIRSEILTSTPTPPADEELRREYQMQLLMQGLGQASQTDDRDWDAMLLEWIGIGAVAPEVHEDLQRRFVRCLAHRPAQHSAGSRFQDQRGGNVRAERDPGERKSRRRRV